MSNLPNTIRIMRFLLFFKIALFFVTLVLIFTSLKDFSVFTGTQGLVNIVTLAVPLAAMIMMLSLIKKRKLFPSLLAALVMFIFPSDQIQYMLSVVLVLLFFLPSTRGYFRGSVAAAPPKKRAPAESGDVEEASEEAKAALEEPDEAPERPLAKLRKDPEIGIREATPADADTVYALMMMAFEEYRTATPPSSALDETEESVQEALSSGAESAAILYEDDTATAMVRFKYDGEAIYFFRLSVVPNRRRRGYARQLVKWIETQGVAKGMKISRCKVRQSVQNNLVLYQNMGYEIVDQELVVRPAGTVKALTLEKKLWE